MISRLLEEVKYYYPSRSIKYSALLLAQKMGVLLLPIKLYRSTLSQPKPLTLSNRRSHNIITCRHMTRVCSTPTSPPCPSSQSSLQSPSLTPTLSSSSTVMTDSNISSRLRKLRFGRRVSPSRSVPTPSKASSVSSQKSKTQLAKIDIYHPLSPPKREIRLLYILPEQPGSLLLGPDPISCVLSHVSLDDKPTYHALSYTWDDESLGQSFEDPDDLKKKRKVLISGFIFLDGQAVEVTPNLWVALWHLRRGANWFKNHPDADVGEFGESLDSQNQWHFTYETPLCKC